MHDEADENSIENYCIADNFRDDCIAVDRNSYDELFKADHKDCCWPSFSDCTNRVSGQSEFRMAGSEHRCVSYRDITFAAFGRMADLQDRRPEF